MNSDWVAFSHPLGLSLSHPAGWRIVQAQEALQLVPDDVDPKAELILAGVAAAPVARIDDPSVIAYVDDSIGQMQPGLRRTDGPSPMQCKAGEGIVLSYSGKLADGRAGAAVVYSVLVEGNAISLTAIGTEEKIGQRKPTLAAVFATFAAGGNAAGAAGEQAQVDQELIGTWRHSRARHEHDRLGGGTSDSSSTTYSLARDGTYTATHTSLIRISLPGGAGGSSTGESASAGTWSANGDFLAVRSEEGGIVFSGTYKVFSNGIELQPTDGGDKILLQRVQ